MGPLGMPPVLPLHTLPGDPPQGTPLVCRQVLDQEQALGHPQGMPSMQDPGTMGLCLGQGQGSGGRTGKSRGALGARLVHRGFLASLA